MLYTMGSRLWIYSTVAVLVIHYVGNYDDESLLFLCGNCLMQYVYIAIFCAEVKFTILYKYLVKETTCKLQLLV